MLTDDLRSTPSADRAGSETPNELLRAAARAHFRQHDADSHDDVALWRGVVAGRWTLVDRFDADGRRYLLARQNDSDTAARVRLSRRQIEAAALAAQGHSIKYISYELGVAPATVTTALERTLAKLGLRNRLELTSIPQEAFR